MKRVPLYPGVPLAAVQSVAPTDLDPSCARCALHKKAKSVCLPARLKRGQDPGAGTLLVVGQYPTQAADTKRRAFEGRSERWLQLLLRRHWPGNVVYDYALRCFPGRATLNASHHNHCRPHLAAIYEEILPDRVLLLGNHAAKGFLGYDRGAASHCNRRGYTYLYPEGIPAFLLPTPRDAATNHFLRRRYEDDLMWALEAEPPEPPLDAVAFALDPTKQDADFLWKYLRGADWFSIDLETYGEMFAPDFRALSIGISADHTDDVVCLYEDALAKGTPTRRAVRQALKSDRWIKRGQNAKYDVQTCRLSLGVDPAPLFGDVRLQFKALNPDGNAKLDQMAELVGMGGHKREAEDILVPEVKRLRAAFRRKHPGVSTKQYRPRAYAYAALPREVNLRYVGRDALATTRLFRHVEPTLRRAYDSALWRTYRRTIDGASQCITNIERNGVAIDREAVEALGTYFAMHIADLDAKLTRYGLDKPASSDQVGEFLYGKLRLPVTNFTKGGKPSTDKATLERMSKVHKAIPMILEWRRITKLYTTYVQGLLPFIRHDGRIHPTLLLDGTGTGRLSCKDPNLQTAPSRGGEEAKMVKDCFIAGEGRILIQADYGTLEVCVAALLSGDVKMIAVLRSGVDFHRQTAMAIGPIVWGMSLAEVAAEIDGGDKTKRVIAKRINFGTLYGQGPYALALQISAELGGAAFTPEQAEAAQNAILGEYTQLSAWIRSQEQHVRKHGSVWTYWDGEPARRRPLYAAGWAGASSKHLRTRAGSALRSSYNTPVQGTGSDYCLMSLIEVERVCRELWGDRCFPVLTVHDSILFDCVADAALVAEVVGVVHDIMTGWPSGDVPLRVDFENGPSWGSLEKMKVDDHGNVRHCGYLEAA